MYYNDSDYFVSGDLGCMKKFIALVTVAAFMFGAVGCSVLRSTSRRSNDRHRDEREEDDDSDELEVEASFGTFIIDNGWVEAEEHSNHPNMYVFCNEDDLDASSAPNNLTVLHDTNYYSEDEHEDFCTAILQQLHGQAASYNGTAAMTEYGRFGENMCYRFDMDCEELDVIQWYVIGDHEYVMFSITIVDEDAAEDDDCIDMAEDAVNSFVWDS